MVISLLVLLLGWLVCECVIGGIMMWFGSVSVLNCSGWNSGFWVMMVFCWCCGLWVVDGLYWMKVWCV